jgi:hypothetical protein
MSIMPNQTINLEVLDSQTFINSSTTKFRTFFVAHLSKRDVQNTMGTRGDPGVTPGTCGAGGEKAQVILLWVRALGVGNASHPRRLGVMREKP